jgi:hypothetical protein
LIRIEAIKTGNKTTAVMMRAIDGGMLDRNDPGFVGGLLFFNRFLFKVPHLGGLLCRDDSA